MERTTTAASLLLLLLAVASPTAGQRGIRTCSCQLREDLSQQGKLVGRACYVVGVGFCSSFTYESESGTEELGPRRPPALRRRGVYRPTSFSDVASALANASPQQHQRAVEDANRQLEANRSLERALLASGRATVRPGSPSAVLAAERRPDAKSIALGNRALAQILYLQSLLGGSGRR
ncbi:uncharacterized protein LOC119092684 [Pollicipes pollicipes]|uniref:uncharacterized protein LOC119092684 n=1 Tax=Pollicipes pollicipes TaxID=41117 RepID=UPI001884FD6C|nr:uncharacterized protein LOC119092684 [Pollicipes pollicipes]